jgi:hypothetical protein
MAMLEKRISRIEERLRPRGRFIGAIWSGDAVTSRDGTVRIERRAGEDAEAFLERCRVELGATEHDIFLVRRII